MRRKERKKTKSLANFQKEGFRAPTRQKDGVTLKNTKEQPIKSIYSGREMVLWKFKSLEYR